MTTENNQSITGKSKCPKVHYFYNSATRIAGVLIFLALLFTTFTCYTYEKPNSLLSHVLSEPLSFDDTGYSNFLIRGRRALSHGYLYSAEKIFTHGIHIMEMSLEDHPTGDDPRYWDNIAGCKQGLAQILINQKQYKQALVHLKEALCSFQMSNLTVSDNYSLILQDLVLVNLELNKPDEAKKYFEQTKTYLEKYGDTNKQNILDELTGKLNNKKI